MNTLDIIRQKQLKAQKLHEARMLMARLNTRANYS